MSTARSRTARLIAALSIAGVSAAGVLLTPGVAQAAVPTITSLSVKKGSTAGGTTTLITGKGFTGATAVEFGTGNAATSFIILGDTTIAATAPAGTGTAEVLVTTTAGTNITTPTSNDFAYLAPISPILTGAVVLSGAGGTTFTVPVTASSVAAAADITSKKITATVDGVAATKVAFSSADTLLVTAPAGTPSSTPVSFNILRDGVAGSPDTTNVTYDAVVSKLSVTTSPTTGTTGTSTKPAITITGVGLTGATTWVFGSAAATCANSTTKPDTTVTCQDIPAASAGPVTVSFTPTSGTVGITSGSTFTYTDLG
jgi:hypothetical protein